MQQADPTRSSHIPTYIAIAIRRKKLILKGTAAAFVLAVIVVLLLPNIYRSTTKILPPQRDTRVMGLLMGQIDQLPDVAGSMMGSGSMRSEVYLEMLKSEQIMDALIDRFHLMEVYDVKYRFDAYKRLDRQTTLTIGKKDGVISISVEDKDPSRAAQMAQTYVDELEKLAVKLNVTDSGNDRGFLEERLASSRRDLSAAEDELKRFQEEHRAISIPDQAKASLKSVAELKGQIAVQEGMLSGLKASKTADNPEVKEAAATISSLKKELSRLEGNGAGYVIPLGAAPQLGKRFVDLLREVKLREAIVETISKQLEMARLSEQKRIAGIQVLQVPKAADKKVKPHRALIVLITTVVAFLLTFMFCVLRDYLDNMPAAERVRWDEFRAALGMKDDAGGA